MQVIQLLPGKGKTASLVKYMLEPGNEDVIYLAPTRKQSADVAMHYARKLGASEASLKGRFMSIADYRAGDALRRGRHSRYVIDELDVVLATLLGAPVELVALTPGKARSEWCEAKRRIGEAQSALHSAEMDLAELESRSLLSAFDTLNAEEAA